MTSLVPKFSHDFSTECTGGGHVLTAAEQRIDGGVLIHRWRRLRRRCVGGWSDVTSKVQQARCALSPCISAHTKLVPLPTAKEWARTHVHASVFLHVLAWRAVGLQIWVWESEPSGSGPHRKESVRCAAICQGDTSRDFYLDSDSPGLSAEICPCQKKRLRWSNIRTINAHHFQRLLYKKELEFFFKAIAERRVSVLGCTA